MRHVDVPPQDTETALGEIERLIERYHGSRNGRQSVWPAPVRCYGATPEWLQGAVELAEDHDVMATTHVSESDTQDRHLFSNVEYLRDAGFLGDRTLVAHCVRISDRDIRMLAATDTRVAHNPLTNLSLGDGVAPVPSLVDGDRVLGIDEEYPDLYERVGPAAAEVVDRAGLGAIAGRPWVTHATQ